MQNIKSVNKNQCLLDAKNEWYNKETKKISFAMESKRIKYLGIKLPDEVKKLHSENNMLLREMKDTIEIHLVYTGWNT